MKKLMLGLGVATLAVTMAAPSFAREETEIIGYVKTERVINERDALFSEVDRNRDGVIDFKEFQRKAMFVNNYEMFKMNDTDNDDLLNLEEFRSFSKWGPARTASGPSGTHYNFNQPGSRMK